MGRSMLQLKFSKTALARIEKAARAAGHDVQTICAKAQVARSTWYHWKRGSARPTGRTWSNFVGALPRNVQKALAA